MELVFPLVAGLIEAGDVLVSNHGYDELAHDNIRVRDLVKDIRAAQVVEEYPDYAKGPCVLLLQYNTAGNPVHSVWGIPKGFSRPAVLVTAYRPDPEKWDADWLRRKR